MVSGQTPTAAAGRDPFLSLKSGGTEVYLIRHGDALPDADEVVTDGSYNSQALSDLGRRQAEALAERMRGLDVAAIYASPIPRAYQTAEPSARALGLDVVVEDGLREIELGDVGPALPDNATAEDHARRLRERLHEIASIAMTSGKWASIPGSESAADLRARATETVERLALAHPGARIALFSHGGTINAYIAEMLGVERDYFFPCANTSISVVRLRGDRRLLLGLNDVGHLQQAGLI